MELENVKEIAVELTSEGPLMEDNDKTLIKKWLEPILSWERDNTGVEALKNGWVVIMDGEIYYPSFEEMSKEEKKKLKYAIRFASHYGVHRVGDELVMETTKERYSLDFHIFLRIITWFADYLK